jgi:predicted KAP-like P-loop ATPase
MFADEVIHDPRHDELDRSGFAKALANVILTMDVESPFVFSIEGKWGWGKTTLLEFVKYYLKHRAEIGPNIPLEIDPIIVDLSPWWFSGSEDLLRQSISEISLQLRSDKRILANLKNLPDLLDRLGAALGPGMHVVPHGAGLRYAAKGLAAILRWLTPTKDVASLRKDIERLLLRQTNRIVVFLDDLDRLQPMEVVQIFQVVKAIANLPRLIYVLSFDRQAVSEALTKANVHNADKYIEKIVQSVWTLPGPDAVGLAKLTGMVIEELLVDTPSNLWQADRWRSLYFNGLKELLRTPRDVKRVANALRGSFAPVRAEVNVIDFIGLHSLRVLAPSVYTFIVSNRGWLTNSEIVFFRDEDHERRNRNVLLDSMLNSLPEGQRDPVNQMLETMFPIIDRGVKRSQFSDASYTQWRRECRICSPDRFDFYDRLSIPSGTISSAELARILRPVSAEAFRNDLQSLASEQAYDGNTKLKKFLEYAPGTVAALTRNERVLLMHAVFASADTFISKLEPPLLPFYSYDFQFSGLADAVIGLVPKGAERVAVITEVWNRASAVSLMVRCFYLWKERQKEYESGRLYITTYFNRAELEELRGALQNRIEAAARDSSLLNTPMLDFVLYFWDEHVPGAGSEFAGRAASTDVGFVNLVVGALQPRPPLSADAAFRSDVQLLEKWTAGKRADLLNRCELILAEPPEWLQEVHKIALRAFVGEVQHPRDQRSNALLSALEIE